MFEKGIKLLKEKGCLSYITSNKFTQVKYGKLLRSYLSSFTISIFIDYSGVKIFKDANVDSSVILIKKEKNNENNIYINKEYYFKQSHISSDVWTFEKPEIYELKEKILKDNLLIKDIKEIKLFYGIKTGYNKAFIIDENIKESLIEQEKKDSKILKPVLRGKDIEKYKINYKNLYLICSKDGINVKKEYPIIYTYLKQYKKNLVKRSDQGTHYTNLRTCKYYDEFMKPKLIWQRVCKKPNFVLDNKQNFYIIDSMVFLTLDDYSTYLLEYLLMILNSNVIEWYLKRIGHKLGKSGFLLSNQYMEQLPIPYTSLENQRYFKQEVLKLIELKKGDDNRNSKLISECENNLNTKVYELFNLTSEEVNIIEKELK